MKVLFVCSGNTCRSPMAEGIFKKISSHSVSSVGILELFHQRASYEAIKVCMDHGIDISNHVSRHVSEVNLADYDLILTMGVAHRNKLDKLCSNCKIFTVKEFLGYTDNLDIADPFGESMEVYENCFCEIYRYLVEINDRLKK